MPDPPTEVLALQVGRLPRQCCCQQLRFTEDNTRKWLIDRDLRLAGWDVPKGTASNESVGQEVEVCTSRPPLARDIATTCCGTTTASRLPLSKPRRPPSLMRAGQEQAKQYADGLEKMHGQRPMIFFTNGHDIWVWDDAGGYPPRSVYGFYSKDTLQYRVGFQRRERLDLIKDGSPRCGNRRAPVPNRECHPSAERFSQRHRRALIVQATGTGKTRVAISLAKLLIDARWAKRVLFLCDRKELRKQAKNAFNDFL
jgi:type I restriction enzyme R subunit